MTTANMKHFKAFFGTTPGICEFIWNNAFLALSIENSGLRFYHLLWGLMFLKLYSTEQILCAHVGGVDEKTFRKYVWIVVPSICTNLKPRVVSYMLFSFL